MNGGTTIAYMKPAPPVTKMFFGVYWLDADGAAIFRRVLLELVQYGEYRRRVICVTIEQLVEGSAVVRRLLDGYANHACRIWAGRSDGGTSSSRFRKKSGDGAPGGRGLQPPASPSPGKSGTGTGTGPRPGPATRAPGPAGAASPARGVSAPWRQPTASEAEALMNAKSTRCASGPADAHDRHRPLPRRRPGPARLNLKLLAMCTA